MPKVPYEELSQNEKIILKRQQEYAAAKLMLSSIKHQQVTCHYCEEAGTICSVCATLDSRVVPLARKQILDSKRDLDRLGGQPTEGMEGQPETVEEWRFKIRKVRERTQLVEPSEEEKAADRIGAVSTYIRAIGRCCKDKLEQCAICRLSTRTMSRLKTKIEEART